MLVFEYQELPEGRPGARYVQVTLYTGLNRRYRAQWQMPHDEWQFLLSLLKPSLSLTIKERPGPPTSTRGEPHENRPSGRLVGPDRNS